MARRLSGLQKDVIALYRKVLRESLKKDRETLVGESSPLSLSDLLSKNRTEATSTGFASLKFKEEAASVKRSDFKRIEYMIRKAEKQLKVLKMPGVKVVGGAH